MRSLHLNVGHGTNPRNCAYRGETDLATQGTVKFFNGGKGFGFITPNNGGKDVFVHISAVQNSGLDTLVDGQQVTFDVEPDRSGKGPKAINLKLA